MSCFYEVDYRPSNGFFRRKIIGSDLRSICLTLHEQEYLPAFKPHCLNIYQQKPVTKFSELDDAAAIELDSSAHLFSEDRTFGAYISANSEVPLDVPCEFVAGLSIAAVGTCCALMPTIFAGVLIAAHSVFRFNSDAPYSNSLNICAYHGSAVDKLDHIFTEIERGVLKEKLLGTPMTAADGAAFEKFYRNVLARL
ncbi:hypothetical protein KY329_01715 [Candidatus Woesearchaeota archaeon]|nr:hypothetical protein [Candidatus Woesearchaeota archaeon]